AEATTRWIAQAGSLVAAVMLGLAFWSDSQHHVGFGPDVIAFTALVALTMVGYALAWTRKWEAAGSVIALAGLLGAFFVVEGPIHVPSDLAVLGVGLPAVVHLVACYFHGRVGPTAAAT
ncbi:MAG: hypothetical protein AAF805_04380, partial [Planctomycetota bacterium]